MRTIHENQFIIYSFLLPAVEPRLDFICHSLSHILIRISINSGDAMELLLNPDFAVEIVIKEKKAIKTGV